jgi:hypothetical protein
VFITNHVLSGALLGLVGPRSPAAVALVGVASHFALDSVPHWGCPDETVFRRVAVVDGLCGLATMAAVLRSVPAPKRAAVAAGMLGACFPDADKPARMFFDRSPFPGSVDRLHSRIQHESSRGVLVEAVSAAAMAVAVRRGVKAIVNRGIKMWASGPIETE